MLTWQTIKDWLWWTFVIERNEFHRSLDLDITAVINGKRTLEEENMRLYHARQRAHELDERWG